MNLTWNNNSYYTGTTAGVHGVAWHANDQYSCACRIPTSYAGLYTVANFNPATTTPSTNFRFYTSTLLTANTNNDNASIASTGAVPYATNNDLHITTAASEFNTGVTIGSVTNDFDGETRPRGPGL